MRMREGARDGMHFTGQIGLLGIDGAVEGPMGQHKDASYLVNYRYSTLGLLSSMGVDLSDEVISFQDLSFHLKWPVGKSGSVSFFGMGGMSSNIFETKRSRGMGRVQGSTRHRVFVKNGCNGGELTIWSMDRYIALQWQ